MEQAQYPQTHGLVMGGANRKAEADKLLKGVISNNNAHTTFSLCKSILKHHVSLKG
jgi:hypothetical protein